MKKGFTIIEFLVVIGIIGILSTIVLGAVKRAKEKAYVVRAKQEFRSIRESLELYSSDNNNSYPADASRNMPSGLEDYLAGNTWPTAPWPGSVYDWDNWDDPLNPQEKIYQISVRFCPSGGDLASCRFPDETWAENFDVNSAYYYCIAGNCRAHIDESVDYPGYCSNCSVQP